MSTLAAILGAGGLVELSGWAILGGHANFTGTGSAPTAQPSSTAQTLAGAQATTASRQLLARVPTSIASSCTPISVPAVDSSQGMDAEVACHPAALGSGGYVIYAHYRTQGAMQHTYDRLTQGVLSGDCTSGPGEGSYSLRSSSQPAGDLACLTNSKGQRVFLWTDNSLTILSTAASNSMTFESLYEWWLGDSGPEHTSPGSQANRPVSPPTNTPQATDTAGSSAGPAAYPADTVRAYFAAINNHDYAQAWKLGGQNTGSSYSSFVSGLSATASDNVTILSVTGNVVTAQLTAQQANGSVKTYQGTYTVSNGVIVAFNVRQVG